MLAFTQAGAAEVETQHREPEVVQRLHGVEDNFVVERPTIKRMRMTNDCRMRRGGRSRIEQRFQAAGRAFEKKRADAGGFGVHGIFVSRWSFQYCRVCPPATSDRRLATTCNDC